MGYFIRQITVHIVGCRIAFFFIRMAGKGIMIRIGCQLNFRRNCVFNSHRFTVRTFPEKERSMVIDGVTAELGGIDRTL